MSEESSGRPAPFQRRIPVLRSKHTLILSILHMPCMYYSTLLFILGPIPPGPLFAGSAIRALAADPLSFQCLQCICLVSPHMDAALPR